MTVRSGEIATADALIQPLRLFPRLDVQCLAQRTAAGLILGQGRAALAAQGQQAHQHPVRLFLPGRQGDLPPGVLARTGVLAPFLVVRS